MFFDTDRIVSMRAMIMATDIEGRKKALDKLLPMQRQDFIELFKIMAGLPVTIRLLDPPLHEFLRIVMKILVTLLRLRGLVSARLKNAQ